MTIPLVLPLMPNTDGLLLSLLRPALPDVQVVTVLPPSEQRAYPVALVRRVGGGRTHSRLLDAPLVVVDTWAQDRRSAERTGERVLQALNYAWQHQLVTDDGDGVAGHIGGFRVDSAPAELRDRDQEADVYRYNAIYSLLIRP